MKRDREKRVEWVEREEREEGRGRGRRGRRERGRLKEKLADQWRGRLAS